MKKIYLILLIILSIFILLIILGNLTKNRNEAKDDIKDNLSVEADNAELGINNSTKGVSLSPVSYSSEDFTNFFIKAKEAGNLISWAGDWHELKKENSPAHTLVGLSKRYEFEPVIITSLPNISEEEDYINTIKKITKENKPKFIGLGNEINNDYKNSYKETFSKAYDEIKKVSSDTEVFTIFQLEKMQQKNDWTLISDFPKADFIAFTTYPVILYQTPSEIPEDYYSKISKHTDKQIAFTEIGWQRKNSEQIDFIEKFSRQTSSINTKFKIWPFLYDQNVQYPFETMGLLQKNQETSESFEKWKKI